MQIAIVMRTILRKLSSKGHSICVRCSMAEAEMTPCLICVVHSHVLPMQNTAMLMLKCCSLPAVMYIFNLYQNYTSGYVPDLIPCMVDTASLRGNTSTKFATEQHNDNGHWRLHAVWADFVALKSYHVAYCWLFLKGIASMRCPVSIHMP